MDSQASSWPEMTPTGPNREIIMEHGQGQGSVPSALNREFYALLLRVATLIGLLGGYFQPLAWLFSLHLGMKGGGIIEVT